MLGGEMAMWTDQYCRTRECLDAGGPLPVAYWMYDKKYNDVFMQSIGGMVLLYSYQLRTWLLTYLYGCYITCNALIESLNFSVSWYTA